MMRLKIIAVGARLPEWAQLASAEFSKRLSHYAKVDLIELAAAKRTKNPIIAKLKQQEAVAIQAQLAKQDIVVALDEHGTCWSSDELAQQLQNWQNQSQTICYVIGGPDGLDDSIKKLAQYQWSLSKLVFPHALVRVILLEQLYRGFSILANHPYHRE